MTTLEEAARHAWLEDAVRIYFGVCSVCQRARDENGRPLLVARREHARIFRCLECFDQREARRAA